MMTVSLNECFIKGRCLISLIRVIKTSVFLLRLDLNNSNKINSYISQFLDRYRVWLYFSPNMYFRCKLIYKHIKIFFLVLTQLASHVPVSLRVKVAGVDAVGRRVNPWELPLVKAQEAFGPVVHRVLSSSLAEWQHVTNRTFKKITEV